ncbi:hypothetical protein ACIBW9_16925 [Streptomyces sp. NPDC049541]|uniref:hypothetical protein n=1 Tax=Streptomyces sp. NPDC049541 TaxID=3365594 RepID=UPI0037B337DB
MTWAGHVLRAAAPGQGRTPVIEAALECAGDRDRWSRGREVFELVRRGWAEEEQFTQEQRILFRLAELVGKVAHNEAGPPPFFDHHAGWQIGPLAWQLASAAPDRDVRDRIADALGERPPEPLDG